MSRNLATFVVRGILTGLSRRRTGLLTSGPKSSFQMRARFVFNLETKVLESGGRVEKQIAQVAWSPVLSFHIQCHLLVFVHLCFLKTKFTAPVYPEILEHFMLSFCWPAFKDSNFIFQQDLAPAHTVKSTKSWLNDHVVGVLDWPVKHIESYRIYVVLSRGKWETRDKKMQMSWRPLSKKPGLPYHLSSATNWSPSCHAELKQ